MAKIKLNYKKLARQQERLNEMYAKRRRNGEFRIPPRKDPIIQAADDVMFEGRYYKPTRKRGKRLI